MASPSSERTPGEYIELFYRTLIERPDYELRDEVLFVFSTMLKTRAQNTASMDDLNATIKAGEEAAEDRAIFFTSLGNSLTERIRRSLKEDVKEADYDLLMQARVIAAELTPPDNVNFLGY